MTESQSLTLSVPQVSLKSRMTETGVSVELEDVSGATATASEGESREGKGKGWLSKTKRLLPLVVFAGILVSINFILDPVLTWFNAVLVDLASHSTGFLALFIVWIIIVCFLTFTFGGGTLPALVLGAAFDYPIALLMSWTAAAVSGILNMLFVRYVLKRLMCECKCKCKCKSDRFSFAEKAKKLDKVLCKNSVPVILLLRLPGLGLCVLNYIFSFSNVPLLKYTLLNSCSIIPAQSLWVAIGLTGRSIIDSISGRGGSLSLGLGIGVLCAMCICIAGLVILSRKLARKRGIDA